MRLEHLLSGAVACEVCVVMKSSALRHVCPSGACMPCVSEGMMPSGPCGRMAVTVRSAVPNLLAAAALFLTSKGRRKPCCLRSPFFDKGRWGARESYSSVGQSATLIMWRSAVQVCLGLLLQFRIQDSKFKIAVRRGRAVWRGRCFLYCTLPVVPGSECRRRNADICRCRPVILHFAF